MNFINLTPHTVRLCDSDGCSLLAVEPSGTVARIEPPPAAQPSRQDGIPVPVRSHRSLSGRALVGLPPRREGTAYIVSLPCLDTARLQERDDVFAPDSGPTAVRRDGQVWGVRALIAALQVPSYCLVYGSSLVRVDASDVDALYYGVDPQCAIGSARMALRSYSHKYLPDLPLDAHEARPHLVKNHEDPAHREWVVEYPTWGTEDNGQITAAASPDRRLGRVTFRATVKRGLASTIRRYVATGAWDLASGEYALEICHPDGNRAGYGGSGLLAVWRAVQHARRRGVAVPVWDAIGDFSEAEILAACELGDRATPQATFAAMHAELAADAAGSPAAGNGATYTYTERGWRAPYRGVSGHHEAPWMSDSEMLERVREWIRAANGR